jgi:hypothetical protein
MDMAQGTGRMTGLPYRSFISVSRRQTAAGWRRSTAQVPVSGWPSAPMKLDVRVPADRRSATLSPELNARAVVLPAARAIVNWSMLRWVHWTISSLLPAASDKVMSMPSAVGVGNFAPSPAVTVRLVAESVRSAESADATGENAKSRTPR